MLTPSRTTVHLQPQPRAQTPFCATERRYGRGFAVAARNFFFLRANQPTVDAKIEALLIFHKQSLQRAPAPRDHVSIYRQATRVLTPYNTRMLRAGG